MRIAKSVCLGVIVAILTSFPMVALFALMFRFPVPFAGYEHGVEAVPRALRGSVLYGMIGGYHALFLMGSICGLAAARLGRSDVHVWKLSALFATSGTTVAVLILSVLDMIIGPW